MSFIVHRQCVHRQGQVLLPENTILSWCTGLVEKGNLDAYKYPNMAELPGFDMTDKAIDYLKIIRHTYNILQIMDIIVH